MDDEAATTPAGTESQSATAKLMAVSEIEINADDKTELTEQDEEFLTAGYDQQAINSLFIRNKTDTYSLRIGAYSDFAAISCM